MSATSTKRWGRARLQAADDVADGVRRLVLEPAEAYPAVPPGSHLDVAVRVAGLDDVRSYSLLGAEPDGRAVSIAVRLDPHGRGGSASLHALPVGASLLVSQPLQSFPLTYGRPRYLLLAGGIGITALHGMAASLAERGVDWRLVYAGRSRKVMPFLDELGAAYGDRVEVAVSEESGRLDVAALVERLEVGTELYVCGPIGMLDAARRAWAQTGRPRAGLRFETFGSSGRFAPEPFTVRIPRLGLETVVPEDLTMLEALERAGADLMYDCRRGECGLCEVTVLDVSGAIDHRDVFYSEAQQATGDRLCTCVSRVVSARTAGTGAATGPGVLSIDVP